MGAQQQMPQNPDEPGFMDRLTGSPLFNMGMGILASNTGHYGATAPALGRGAMLGMQSLQDMRQAQALQSWRKTQEDMAREKLERTQRLQEMWGQVSGGGMGEGRSPVTDAQALRTMAVQAGQMGDATTATQLMKLSYEVDPQVQGQLAAIKEGTSAAFAGPKAYAEKQAGAQFDFMPVGGRLMSKAQMQRLETGVQLAGGDPYYGAALAIEAPAGFDPTGRGPVTRSGGQAVGVPQMMPGTLQAYGHTPETFAALSAGEQARIGKDFYDQQLAKYGEPTLAWAAYNWGPGNVDAALEGLPPDASPWQRTWTVYGKAPAETRKYMEQASAYAAMAQQQRPDPLRVPSEAETAEQVEFAKMGAEDLKAARATVTQADVKIGTLQVMEQLLDKIKTGAFQPTITDIKGYADALGISMPGIENLAPAQAFDALAKQLTLKARTTADGGGMPGAMSDADREFLRKMVPGLEKTKGANRLLIDITRRLAMREQQLAQIRVNYARKYNTMRPTVDPKTGIKVSIDDAIADFVNRPGSALFSQDYVDSMLGSGGF